MGKITQTRLSVGEMFNSQGRTLLSAFRRHVKRNTIPLRNRHENLRKNYFVDVRLVRNDRHQEGIPPILFGVFFLFIRSVFTLLIPFNTQTPIESLLKKGSNVKGHR
jgi:hypothetical protein